MKFKVSKSQIEFSDLLGKVIISAGTEIKFILYKPRIYRGKHEPIYAVMLSPENPKIISRFPYPFQKTNKNLVFYSYKRARETIEKIKESGFPVGFDLSMAEKILKG